MHDPLGKLGFKLTEVDRNGNFFEYFAQEVRRIPYCSQTYSEAELSYADFETIDEMLALLDSINQTNQKSEELLCLGYYIVAIKESSPSDSLTTE